jgi:hypothetical protein
MSHIEMRFEINISKAKYTPTQLHGNRLTSRLTEQPPHQASGKIANDRTTEGAIRECRCLAEAVTSGECGCVCDCQDKGDS